jgi:hypothetical protein
MLHDAAGVRREAMPAWDGYGLGRLIHCLALFVVSWEPPTGEGGRAHDKVCNTDCDYQEPAGSKPSLPRPALRRTNDSSREN